MESKQLTTNQYLLAHHSHRLRLSASLLPHRLGTNLTLTNSHHSHSFPPQSFNLNSTTSTRLCRRKHHTSQLLSAHHLPTPNSIIITPHSRLFHLPPFPLVLKPPTGSKGRHVFTHINSISQLRSLTRRLFRLYPRLIIQPFISGHNDRFLVLNHRVISVARRHPPSIIGDGKHTIRQLIQLHNQRVSSQPFHHHFRHPLTNHSQIIFHLHSQGFRLHHIPPPNRSIILYPIANFQTGGHVTTLPLSTIPPSLISLAQTASRLFQLTICGIDMIVPSNPLHATILEINSYPSLRLHQLPNHGQPVPVTQSLLRSIFPTSTPTSLL